MTRRTIVLTGASDGIGAAAARLLAARGDRVLLTGRSPEKLAAVAEPIGAEHVVADLATFADVRDLAAWVRERADRIDVLVNNAGGVFAERAVTVDGNERTMQVNHYSHFLLTRLLQDLLLDSSATIVNVSSVASRYFGRLDLSDLDHAKRYRPIKAYGDAKLANILFTKGLHTRFHAQGLNAVAVHPGNIASNFGSAGSAWVRLVYRTPIARFLATPDTGAANLIWAIDGPPGDAWASGEYYEARKLPRRPNPQQRDEALIDAFWRESERRIGPFVG